MATEADFLVERDYGGELLERVKKYYEDITTCCDELKKTSEILIAEQKKMQAEIQKMKTENQLIKAEIEKQRRINQNEIEIFGALPALASQVTMLDGIVINNTRDYTKYLDHEGTRQLSSTIMDKWVELYKLLQ